VIARIPLRDKAEAAYVELQAIRRNQILHRGRAGKDDSSALQSQPGVEAGSDSSQNLRHAATDALLGGEMKIRGTSWRIQFIACDRHRQARTNSPCILGEVGLLQNADSPAVRVRIASGNACG
jgi:hypothetical protein